MLSKYMKSTFILLIPIIQINTIKISTLHSFISTHSSLNLFSFDMFFFFFSLLFYSSPHAIANKWLSCSFLEGSWVEWVMKFSKVQTVSHLPFNWLTNEKSFLTSCGKTGIKFKDPHDTIVLISAFTLWVGDTHT